MSATDHSDMKQELKRRTKQYRVMKERNQELSDEMQSIKSSLQARQQSTEPNHAATIPTHQARRSEVKFDALKLQIGDLNQRRKVLQHEVHTLTGSLAKETGRADTLQSTVTALEQELEGRACSITLKKKALKIQKENKGLKECASRHEQQIRQLQVGGDFASERVDLLQQIAVQQEALSKLKESCDNADRHVEQLTKEASKGSGATETAAETAAEVAALRAGVKQYKKQIKTLLVEKSTTHKRIQDIECQLLESSGADLETRCNEQHVVIQELHREIQRNKEDLSSLAGDNSRDEAKDHQLEIRPDESHISYLNENIATLELQMAQMLHGLENIETNTSAIVVNAEKILSYSGVEVRAKHSASAITKASKKILKILETMS